MPRNNKPIDKPIAAIDIGSNTVHLTVIQPGRGGALPHLLSDSRIVKLGRVVEEDGRLPVSLIPSIAGTLKHYIRQAEHAGASVILIGATAAFRTAPNGAALAVRLCHIINVPVRLLSEKREAELGLLGVRPDLRERGNLLVVDSGGGSTELTLCRGRKPVSRVSLPIGAARLAVLFKGDPPEPLEFAGLMVPIHAALSMAPKGLMPQSALFTGGSAHHIVALTGSGPHRLTRADLNRGLRRLLRKPAKKISKKYDVRLEAVPLLIPGGLILGSVLDHYGLSRARVTRRTVRDGMVSAYLKVGDAWWKG